MKLTLLILFTLTCCGLSLASTYYVNDNSTSGDVYCTAIGSNLNPGTSSAPFATLDHVVNTITLIPGDTVFVDAGYFYQTDANLNLNVSNIAIIGAGSSLTIFDNDQGSVDANRWASITANNITIQGIKITGYNYGLGGASALDINGATGILIIDLLSDENKPGGGASSIVVGGASQVDFIGGGSNCNTALSVAGGGVNVEGSGNLVAFFDYSFSNNSKDWQGGSGLYISGDNSTTVTVSNSIFADNRNASATGGAAVYIAGSNLTIDSSCFSDNTYTYSGGPAYGGAISVGRGATLSISNCSFSNNSCSSSGKGGAIAINTGFSGSGSASIVNIDTCSFLNNSASSEGNDLYARVGSGNPATFNVNECSFSGTALDIREDNTATINIQNSGNPTATGVGINFINTTAFSASVSTNCPALTGSCYTPLCTPPSPFTLSGIPNPICIGDSATISISGSEVGVTYQLRDDSDSSAIGLPISGTGGVISFSTGPLASTASFNVLASEITLPTCQTGLGPITIVVEAPPTINAGPNTVLCSGDTIPLGGSPTATGGSGVYTYSWSPATSLSNPSDANPLAFPTIDTWYFLSVQSGSCTVFDSVEITASPLPIADAGSAVLEICSADTVVIGGSPSGTGGSGALTYEWLPNTAIDTNTNPNPLVFPTTSTMYTLEVRDSIGCSSLDTAFVFVHPVPIAVAVVSASTLCEGDTVQLNASSSSGGSGGLSYHWSPGTSISDSLAPTVSSWPSDTTLYILTVTDTNMCTATDSILLFVQPIPQIDLSGTVTTPDTCSSSSGSIVGTAATSSSGSISYLWSDSSAIIGTSPNLLNLASGTYFLTVTDSIGCSADAGPFVVSEIAGPSVDSGMVNITLASCGASDGSITGIIVAGGSLPYTFQWTDGASIVGTGIDLLNITTGTYTLSVTDANGCVGFAGPFTVSEFGSPIIDVTLLSITAETCDSANASIDGISITGGSAPFTFEWTDGISIIDSTLSLNELESGSYFLTVVDSNDCTSEYGPITVPGISGPEIDTAGLIVTNTSCGLNNGSITGILVNSGSALDILWSTGDTLLDLFGLESGSYTLMVTDTNGCLTSAGITLGSDGSPTANGTDDYATTPANTPVEINAGLNDFGDISTIHIISGPSSGSAVNIGSGIIEYIPNTGFFGQDTIVYEICDSLCSNLCDTALIFITVEEETTMDIPNGFSPNGDGINDVFYIEGLEKYPNNDIIIFNRWGNEVFSAQPYNNDWNGKSVSGNLKVSGEVVVDGTYYFVLNLNEPGELPVNGFIELRRN